MGGYQVNISGIQVCTHTTDKVAVDMEKNMQIERHIKYDTIKNTPKPVIDYWNAKVEEIAEPEL